MVVFFLNYFFKLSQAQATSGHNNGSMNKTQPMSLLEVCITNLSNFYMLVVIIRSSNCFTHHGSAQTASRFVLCVLDLWSTFLEHGFYSGRPDLLASIRGFFLSHRFFSRRPPTNTFVIFRYFLSFHILQ